MSVPLNDWHVPSLVQRCPRCHGNDPAPRLGGDTHETHQDRGEVSQLSATHPRTGWPANLSSAFAKKYHLGDKKPLSNSVESCKRSAPRHSPLPSHCAVLQPLVSQQRSHLKSTEANEFIKSKRKKKFLLLYLGRADWSQWHQSAFSDFGVAQRRFWWVPNRTSPGSAGDVTMSKSHVRPGHVAIRALWALGVHR